MCRTHGAVGGGSWSPPAQTTMAREGGTHAAGSPSCAGDLAGERCRPSCQRRLERGVRKFSLQLTKSPRMPNNKQTKTTVTEQAWQEPTRIRPQRRRRFFFSQIGNSSHLPATTQKNLALLTLSLENCDLFLFSFNRLRMHLKKKTFYSFNASPVKINLS